MKIIISVIATTIVCFIIHIVSKGKQEVKTSITNDNDTNNTDMKLDKDTYSEKRCRELCLKTLRELNCEVQITEEDVFEFAFQGYRFAIVYGAGFIRIMLLDWHEIDLDDIDMLAKARRLINEMNTDDPLPCLMYFISEEEHKMFIRAMTDTLFIREIPDTIRYLYNNLEWFFPKVFEFKNRIKQEE